MPENNLDTATLSEINTHSLAEKAYALLEEKLVTLQLVPGSLVSEGDLIEMTRIGRTPVREAIQRLAQQELFEVIPRKGLLVAEVSRSSTAMIASEAFCAPLKSRRATSRAICECAEMASDN